MVSAPPTEPDIRAEWEKSPDRFRSLALWEVSHILCACDPQDDEDRAKALDRAKLLTGPALDNRKGLSTSASRESDCGSKSSGGFLGQLGPGDTVPEFEASVSQLGEGEITPDPVLSRQGYHIIRLDAVAKGQPLPYPALGQKISDAMEILAWVRGSRAFVNQLISAAEVSGAELTATEQHRPTPAI